MWQLLEDQANHPWDFGSGHPLYRHLLWRVAGGYFAVHCYHHASGDGSTGLLAMKGIFERYAKLVDGEKVGETSLTPMESVEAITSSVNLDDGKAKVEKLLAAKVERGKNFKTIVPFSIKEMEMVNSQPLPLNRTLWREGTPANYQAMHLSGLVAGQRVSLLVDYLWLLPTWHRQRLWSRPPRLHLSHRFSVTSLSMCDSISTLPLGISIVGYTSLR